MNTESIALICGVALIAVGCGIFERLGTDKIVTEFAKLRWFVKLIVTTVGVCLVLPYVATAWNASFHGHLFAQPKAIEIDQLWLTFGPQTLSLSNSNRQTPTLIAQDSPIPGGDGKPNGGREWHVKSTFVQRFIHAPTVVASFSELPAFVSGTRFNVLVTSDPNDPQTFDLKISVYPKPGTNFTQADEDAMKWAQFAVGCIATESP